MRTDILYSTYAKDSAFAEYSFRSLRKFTKGFGEVICVVPNPDVELFQNIGQYFDITIKGFEEPPGKGMLAHQAIILNADNWCPDADAVLHLDPDCIFWEDCTPADYFADGKPILYRELFEDFEAIHPTRYGWKKTIQDATGINADYECMARHPSVHLNELYARARQRIELHTGRDYMSYILSCENSYPQTFAEFPTLGAVALDEIPDKYHWVDQSNGGRDYVYTHGRDKIVGLWSHSGIDGTCDRHPGKTAREFIEEILK